MGFKRSEEESLQQILILGGGGHARVLIDLIRSAGEYDISGILDTRFEATALISGIPVLGKDDLLPELYANGARHVCIGIGSIGDNSKRAKLYETVKHIGFSIPPLVHTQAIVSKQSKIAEGAQVMAGAIIQTDSLIDENTIINTGAIVEHDCRIGKHVHVCPGVVISGSVTIDDSAFIGVGATIIQGAKIGGNAIVAAGAVVISDVPDNSKVMGVPAR